MTLSDRISSAKFILPNWSLTPALRCQPPKQSALGVYVKRYMTLAMQLLRICGFLVMAVAAWNHAPLAILAGLTVVAAGWAQRRDCRLNRRLGPLRPAVTTICGGKLPAWLDQSMLRLPNVRFWHIADR